MTTANGVGRLYPPEVELLEPRAAWKQKSPQVGLGINLVCLRLRVLLSGQLGLLSLLELFLMGILLVIRAGHRSQDSGEITEMWRLKMGTAGAAVSVGQRGWTWPFDRCALIRTGGGFGEKETAHARMLWPTAVVCAKGIASVVNKATTVEHTAMLTPRVMSLVKIVKLKLKCQNTIQQLHPPLALLSSWSGAHPAGVTVPIREPHQCLRT